MLLWWDGRSLKALRGVLWMVEVLHPATIYAASSSQIVDLPLGVNMSVKNIGGPKKKQKETAKR
jgi:hypothetical protein